jgi:8-oxo-dGTP diphosphatase
VRELREELGIEADVPATPAWELSEDPSSDAGLVLSLWVVDEWRGTPANAAPDEHDELRWVRSADLAGLRLAHPSYREVLERILR